MNPSVNFFQIDELLHYIQPIFTNIAESYDIARWYIERWHWDEPRLTLTWSGVDGIGRNMSVFINEENGQPNNLELEINAWMDRDEKKGEVRNRKWRHEIVRRVSLSLGPPVEELREACDKAYNLVSGWTLADLTNETQITPAATA